MLNQNGLLAVKKHKDEIAFIKNIDKWEIELIIDNDAHEENNLPDWYGYKRIDII